MATSTGKAARRSGGNRFSCKRNRRHAKHDKKFTNNVMTSEQYHKEKARV